MARLGIGLVVLAVAARAGDLDEARAMLHSREIAVRLEGIEALQRLDSRLAVDLLEETIRTSNREMERGSDAIDRLLAAEIKLLPAVRRVLRQLEAGIDATAEADALIKKLNALDAEIEHAQKDTRLHLQIVGAAGRAMRGFRNEEAVKTVERGALTEANPLLRQFYIGGLRDASRRASVPTLLQLLDSRDPRIRAAAVRALIPLAREPGVMERVKLLRTDENWAVRLGAIQAMTAAPFAEAVEYLVGAAGAETGEMAHAADSYLCALTGQSFSQGPAHWKVWWDANGAAVRAGTWAAAPAEEVADGEVRTVASFFRIPLESDRILFALDFSASMSEPLELNDPAIQRLMRLHKLETTRLGYAQAEFIRAISALPDGILFNVLGYNDDVKRFNVGMIRLDASSRARAIRWVTRLETAELTNIFEALHGAFQDYLSIGPGEQRFKDLPDTVVLLTDGIATRGRFTEAVDLIALVEMWNQPLDIVFHCVGIGEDHDRVLLQQLAGFTGGYYVDVTKGLKQIEPRRRKLPEGVTAVAGPTAEERAAENTASIDRLLDLLQEADAEKRAAAARDLGKLGARAARAAETLVYALQDVSPDVQAAAIEALGSIGEPAVPYLIGALKVDDVDCIVGAAKALERIGPPARAALPALEERKEEEDERVRDAVRAACAAIAGAR